MNRFFIKHKLSIGDVIHLSDSDSEFVINNLKLKPENFIEVETYESIFLGVITDTSNNSVEVEIIEKIEDKRSKMTFDVTVVQSLIGRERMNLVIEKAVEIGIDRIIPVQSQYSNIKKNKAIKEYGLWGKIVKDAVEQSRNIKPTVIEKPIRLEDLKIGDNVNKMCLSTENTDSISLRKYFEGIDIKHPILFAVGPEKGWGSRDIEFFKENNFKFVKLEGNILRSESTGLVVGSIIEYLKGNI